MNGRHEMHAIMRCCAIIGLIGGLTACGTTPEERAITGAGLGAAGGAIIGAVTGLTVLEAALIGTGVGGATGLLADENDLAGYRDALGRLLSDLCLRNKLGAQARQRILQRHGIEAAAATLQSALETLLSVRGEPAIMRSME